jgi:hypothetical protein
VHLTLGSFVCLLCLATPLFAQSTDEIALIRKVFTKLQPLSIRYDREYCGYIGTDAAGVLRATEPFPGDASSCLPPDPVDLAVIIASYHTHAAFSRDFHNEIPSQQDVEGDAEDGIDGYVATPGGRLWYVDGRAMTVHQICPVNCLPADPGFLFYDSGVVVKTYTLDALIEKLDE